MDINNISINTQSSIRIEFEKIIYFDPFKIDDSNNDADIIFITHDHYDHLDIESINNIKKDSTIVVAPLSIKDKIESINFSKYYYLNSNDEIDLDDIHVKAVHAYNLNKNYHKKEYNWLGYLITYKDITYFIAGDTDANEDNLLVKCDVAIIPIGGTYTMDYKEASDYLKRINPSVAIPTHYGSIIGSTSDGKHLKDLLKDTSIEVIEKLNFSE